MSSSKMKESEFELRSTTFEKPQEEYYQDKTLSYCQTQRAEIEEITMVRVEKIGDGGKGLVLSKVEIREKI